MDVLAIAFFGALIRGVFFGFLTQHIATSKGYETGFAWGFWLGVIGVIVVAVKPEVNASVRDYGGRSQYWKRLAGELPEQEPWRCVCGQENAAGLHYCIRCRRMKEEGESKASLKVECLYCGAMNKNTNEHCFACGRSLQPGRNQEDKILHSNKENDMETNFDALKKLAELRDLGILTEEEYQEKKSSIMAKL